MTSTNTLTGGQVMSRIFQAYGIGTVFCLAGAAHAHALYAFADDGLHIVSGRHETGSVGAADGYARITGRPGVAMIAGYQGLPNAMGGVRTAQLACSPVVLILSLHVANTRESTSEETNDGLDMVKPFVKWAKVVPDALRLAEYIHVALQQAMSGRPGVAVLGVPQNMESAVIDGVIDLAPRTLGAPAFAPGDDAIAAAAEIISSARQPMMIAGSGAAWSGAGPALNALATQHNIPVLGHALGRGLVAEDMRLGFGWSLAQVAARQADVVISVGARLTQRFGYGLAPRFRADAKFVQIDVAAEEFSRNRVIEAPLHGDARLTLEKLTHALPPTKRGRPTWVTEAMAARLERIDSLGQDADGPIHPYRLGRDLMDAMPPDAIFVGDGADILNWMLGVVRVRSPRSYLDHYPLGSMGIGTPLALGAAAGERELAAATGRKPRHVVLVTGDGSFGFYTAELNAMTLAELNVTIVIGNDGGWGTERNGQLQSSGRNINCDLGFCDYHLIGHAYGCAGERIEKGSDIKPALQRALVSSRPTVLNIITDPKAGLVRKQDPRLQMITFEDLPSSHKAHAAPDVA
jgi:acetolactate synthase I/II/III large subunit